MKYTSAFPYGIKSTPKTTGAFSIAGIKCRRIKLFESGHKAS